MTTVAWKLRAISGMGKSRPPGNQMFFGSGEEIISPALYDTIYIVGILLQHLFLDSGFVLS